MGKASRRPYSTHVRNGRGGHKAFYKCRFPLLTSSSRPNQTNKTCKRKITQMLSNVININEKQRKRHRPVNEVLYKYFPSRLSIFLRLVLFSWTQNDVQKVTCKCLLLTNIPHTHMISTLCHSFKLFLLAVR